MDVCERPTIIFLISSLGVGGSETKVVKLANSFAKAGEKVEVFYLNPPDTLAESFDARISVSCLQRRGKYSLSALYRFGRSISGRNVVIVAVYLYPLLYALPARRLWASKSSRVVCLINTTDLPDDDRWHGRIFAPFLRMCDCLIYGCKSQQFLWSAKYGLPLGKSTYIYNGVDETRFAPADDCRTAFVTREELNIPANSFVLGGVGRLAAEKDFQLLVRLLSVLKADGIEAYLILVGEGPEEVRLKQLAETLGVSKSVRFLGLLIDIRPVMLAMDVFILPSRAVETFSNAALEAMAMAKPVVLSNIGGASEMVVSGISGMLFPSGDLDLLVDHVCRLSKSEVLRKSFGLEARNRVIASFKYSEMFESYRHVLFGWNEN